MFRFGGDEDGVEAREEGRPGGRRREAGSEGGPPALEEARQTLPALGVVRVPDQRTPVGDTPGLHRLLDDRCRVVVLSFLVTAVPHRLLLHCGFRRCCVPFPFRSRLFSPIPKFEIVWEIIWTSRKINQEFIFFFKSFQVPFLLICGHIRKREFEHGGEGAVSPRPEAGGPQGARH